MFHERNIATIKQSPGFSISLACRLNYLLLSPLMCNYLRKDFDSQVEMAEYCH